MHTFDPDDDAYASNAFDDRNGDDDEIEPIDVEVDADAALALLDRVTSELPDGGERREGQRDMVRVVVDALARRKHHVVEAGTGVGKSLAYLVPATLAPSRVVVATATKNLQDQLAAKDAPQVATRTPGVRVAVLKGRENYLCKHRAFGQGSDGRLELDGDDVPKGVAEQMRRVLAWSNETPTGDFDELPFELDPRAKRNLSVTPHECLTRARCPQGASCFAELARDRAAESSILVVNSHLYASHLASGSMLLPAHDFVIFDEAHQLRDIFATLLGTSLSAGRLRALGAGARLLLDGAHRDAAEALLSCADRLATALTEQYDAGDVTGLREAGARELSRATQLVTGLVEALRDYDGNGPGGEFRKVQVLGPAIHLANDLERVHKVRDGELLYLSRREREVLIEVSLVDVGPRLRDVLWPHVTAVLTSATIADSLPEDLGLDVPVERVASPFDYEHHSLLYVPDDLPGRNDPGAEAAIIDELVVLIEAAGGRTLALFTNRAVMTRCATAVAERVSTEVLVQGTLSRARLIDAFRHSDEASLFAVTSFWQGVDVPGHSLSLVTIDRLPFAVPSDPLARARRERAARPFYDVDLPRATMLLAQGVGRLIRTREDRGVVAVLDTRLASASYRASMFRRLPPMRRTRDRDEVLTFLRELRA